MTGQLAGPNLTNLGSISIVAQPAQANLVDEYPMLSNPVVLGRGKTMFEGPPDTARLRLTYTHVFRNGNVLLTCVPAGA